MTTAETEALIRRRMAVLQTGDSDAILRDYTDESTTRTPDGPVCGLENLRSLFDMFFAGPMSEIRSFEVLRQDCSGELGYLVRKTETAAVEIPMATDSFVVRDGRIVSQNGGKRKLFPKRGPDSIVLDSEAVAQAENSLRTAALTTRPCT